ncbi:MAG TPA: PEP/pyruvate-binding domain-containing protein [Patescibacteria group bacterium]|nr:PEP/pyruvate-binding domain-containing protein [Patescibacteria group bacterium]
MKHLAFFKDIDKNSVSLAGGKGASLGEMTKAGIPVPPGFVVLADAFDRFIAETDLKTEIEARLAEVNPNDINTVDKASNVIRDVIADTPMPEDLTTQILSAYDELGAEFVAVRSSATAEDSEVASWAGELESYLNTTRDNVVERVKRCWSSLFTPRAIFYRHEKKLLDSYVSVAVVVQKMVQSEISGIAFTVHPVTEDPDQMIIEAGYGLGEAIVSGQVTPDSYVIHKRDWLITDISIGQQGKKLVKNQGGNNEWIELSEEDGGRQKLPGRQIIAVAEICRKIEDHYGFPCDIEWAIEKGDIHITQSRPITTLKAKEKA